MSDVAANAQAGQMMTADGIPLKKSLKASLRREKLRAFGLVAGPALFILILFVWPIYALFQKSIDDSFVNDVLPRTMAIYEKWNGIDLPGEPHFEAMYLDLTTAEKLHIGKVSTRMNYAKSGWKSLIKKSNRKFKKIDAEQPLQAQMIKADKRWGDVAVLEVSWDYERQNHSRVLLERD
jgi:putative spermidine/putrescine transport system permease protein